jgi:uridine kinase
MKKRLQILQIKISKNKNLKVILIAGPSSSGKTTFAKRLQLQLHINRIKFNCNISR